MGHVRVRSTNAMLGKSSHYGIAIWRKFDLLTDDAHILGKGKT